MKITTWSVMAGAALALVGCDDDDFNTPWLLNHVRILAIQAEPPQPAMGQSTTLRALVYQPPAKGDAGATEVVTGYHWSWCPTATMPDDPAKCPVTQEMADQLFEGVPGVPPLDLGNGETATFTNPFPASMLAPLCLPREQGSDRFGGMSFACKIAGFPITIQLVVDAVVDGVPKKFPGIFSVYLPVNDAIPPNHNPEVGAINLFEEETKYPIDEAGTWSAVRGGKAPLLLDMPESSSEPLPTWKEVYPADTSGKDLHLSPNEQLNVFWYTESGLFDGKRGEDSTVYYGDPNDSNALFSWALENTLRPDKLDKYDGATARLYVVVLDKRNGVNWTTGVLRMVNNAENRDGGAGDGPADAGPPFDAPESDAAEDGEEVDAQAEVLP